MVPFIGPVIDRMQYVLFEEGVHLPVPAWRGVSLPPGVHDGPPRLVKASCRIGSGAQVWGDAVSKGPKSVRLSSQSGSPLG